MELQSQQEEARKHFLPPGYKFYPNYQEVIEYYLTPKLLGLPCPCRTVAKVDVYPLRRLIFVA
jgi:hypothetical protein